MTERRGKGRPKLGEAVEPMGTLGVRVSSRSRKQLKNLSIELQVSMGEIVERLISEAFERYLATLSKVPNAGAGESDRPAAELLMEFLRACRSQNPPGKLEIIKLAHDLGQSARLGGIELDEEELTCFRDCLVQNQASRVTNFS